jgi:uncharacterized membrane protein YcjF (UPF0283 family)
MEIFLNIFWVLITLAGVIAWRTRWSRQTRLWRHAAWREWSAFVCAMVLLFFVVSLTDDLHAELMLLEECSTSRRHATCVVCAHHSSPPDGGGAAHAWVIPQAVPHVESLVSCALVLPTLEKQELRLDLKRAADRAPPASVL